MTVRVFMLVRRGKMDETPVCVYPWEKPILELIHGQDIEFVTIDDMAEVRDGVAKIELAKLNYSKFHGPSLKQQLEGMAYVNPEADPAKDPASEWNRLIEKYGADEELPLPVVERVYGAFDGGRFTAVLETFGKESMPKPAHLKAAEEGLGKPVDQMTVSEIRAALDERDVPYERNATKKQLIELLEGALVE
jgi:hypothetical protein